MAPGEFSAGERHEIDRAIRAAEQASRCEFSVYVGAADGPPRPFAERLHAALVAPTRSVLILVDHLPAVTLLLRVRGNSPIELDALRRRRELDDRLADLVREAMAKGALRTDLPPDLASRLLFGTVNSLVEWVRPDGGYDADTLADAVTTLVLDGLHA